jgi:hypothetical protein
LVWPVSKARRKTGQSKRRAALPVNNFPVLPPPLARISNEINGFYDFCRKCPSLHFVQTLRKRGRFIGHAGRRMKKSSAKCISYISYARAENDSGKLPGMTELAEIQIGCDAHLPGSGIR